MNADKYFERYNEARMSGTGTILSAYIAAKSVEMFTVPLETVQATELFAAAGIFAEVVNPAQIVVPGLH